jgi:transcriptional regulator with XRE-family HTH domain
VNIPPGSRNQPDDDVNSDNGDSVSPDIDEAVEAAIRYVDDPDHVPTDLSRSARLLIQAIAAGRADQATFDAIGSRRDVPAPPPLEQDPLAVALGLVAADHLTLSGARLKEARQKAGLKPSVLARQLAAAGHPITAGELQRWENDAAVTISTPAMQTLALALHVPVSELSSGGAPAVPPGLAMSRQFRDLVRRWAEHTNDTLIAAQTALLQVAAAPARRGTARDDAAIIAALQAFVDAQTPPLPS